MKISTKLLLCIQITFVALFTSQIRGDIDVTQIKGLHTIVKPETSHLSPLHGFAWWKSGLLENLYRFGDEENDKTAQLIRELFYLNPADGITFACTRLPSKPATYFTARTIGTIIVTLERHAGKDEHSLREELKTALEKEAGFTTAVQKATAEKAQRAAEKEHEVTRLSHNIAEQETTLGIPQLRTELLELRRGKRKMARALNQVKPIEQNANFVEYYVALKGTHRKTETVLAEEIKKKENEISDKERDETLKKLKEDLDRVKTEKRSLDQEIRQIDKIYTDQLGPFVTILADAFEETLPGDHQKHVPLTLHNILLAFLWKKVDSKTEFLDYFSSAVPQEMITDPQILERDSAPQKRWLKETYQKEIYQKCLKEFEETIQQSKENPERLLDYVATEYEKLLCSFHAHNLSSKQFPPQAQQQNPVHKDIPFPDCVEASLRNFFNILMYDAEADTLNFNILFKAFGEENIHDRLKSFYQSPYGAIANIQSLETSNAWAKVVSELNDPHDSKPITYIRPSTNPICEIKTDAQNILRVMNKLIGVQSFRELAEKLRTNAGVHLQVLAELDQGNHLGKITFTLNYLNVFEWHFSRGHSWIEMSQRSSSQVQLSWEHCIKAWGGKPTTPSHNNILNLIMQCKSKEGLRELFEGPNCHTFTKEFPPASLVHTFFMLYELRSHDQKLRFIDQILHNTMLTNLSLHPSLIVLLPKMIKGLPADNYYRKKIIQLLSQCPQQLEKYELLFDIVTNNAQQITDDFEKIDVFLALYKQYDFSQKVRMLQKIIYSLPTEVRIPSYMSEEKKIKMIQKLSEYENLYQQLPEVKRVIESIARQVNANQIGVTIPTAYDSWGYGRGSEQTVHEWKKLAAIKRLLSAKKLIAHLPILGDLITNIAREICDDEVKRTLLYNLLKNRELLGEIPQLCFIFTKVALSLTRDEDMLTAIDNLLNQQEPLPKSIVYIVFDIVKLIRQDEVKVAAIQTLLSAQGLFQDRIELIKLLSNIAHSIQDNFQKVAAIGVSCENDELDERVEDLKKIILPLIEAIRPSKIGVSYLWSEPSVDDTKKVKAIKILIKTKNLWKDIPGFIPLIEQIARLITDDFQRVKAIESLLNETDVCDTFRRLVIELAQNVTPTSIEYDFNKAYSFQSLINAKEILDEIPTYILTRLALAITHDLWKLDVIQTLLQAKVLLTKSPELKELLATIAEKKLVPENITSDKTLLVISDLLESKELLMEIPALNALLIALAQQTRDLQQCPPSWIANTFFAMYENAEFIRAHNELARALEPLFKKITDHLSTFTSEDKECLREEQRQKLIEIAKALGSSTNP